MVAIVGVWALAACSTGGGTDTAAGSAPGPSTYTYDQTAQVISDVSCDQIVECRIEVAGFSLASKTSCARFAGNKGDPEVTKALAAGTAKWDGEKAAACVKKLKALGCDGNAATFEESVLDSAGVKCSDAVIPLAEVGDPCERDFLCKSGYCKRLNGCPGRCEAIKKAGEACTFSDKCGDGLSCIKSKCAKPGDGKAGSVCGGSADCLSGACQNGVCIAGPARSDKCSLFKPCAKGLVCVKETCTKPQKLGEACELSFFGPGTCEQGLSCSAGKCAKLKAIGESCTNGGQCFGVDSTCEDGACAVVPLSDEGGPCKPPILHEGKLIPWGCKVGLTCGAGNTCRKPPKAGEPCVHGGCGEGLKCDKSKICQGPVNEGGACDSGKWCAKATACINGKCVKLTCGS